MAKVQRSENADGEFTDKIPMGDLKPEGAPYVITGFEYKEFNPGEKTPCLLLQGSLHVEVKDRANNELIDAWGDDTDDWVGQTVTISKKQFSKGAGRLVVPDTAAPKVDVGKAPF